MKRITYGLLGVLLVGGLLAAAIFSASAATTYNLTFGGAYAAASYATGTTAQHYTGSGSWYKEYPGTKTELHIDPLASFGTSFTVDEIASVTYHTLNNADNPSGVDFYLLIYTMPCTGGDASWYCHRLNAEPYLSNSYSAPVAGVWNTWTTDSGSNQLTFFDANACGAYGFYGAPTLQNIQAGAINWAAFPACNATAPTRDYGSETIKYLTFSTGSGWSAFKGWLDSITIELTSGVVYQIDLENFSSEVYVDDGWAGSLVGEEVAPGKFFGYNAFDTVQKGIDNVAAAGTVNVNNGTYEEAVVITKDLTVKGASLGAVIQAPTSIPTCFTTSSAKKPIICIKGNANAVVDTLTIDGLGRGNANVQFVGVAFSNAAGQVKNSVIRDIRDTPFSGAQHGVGIYAYNDDGVTRSISVNGNTITGFQKNAMALNAGATTPLDVNVTGNTITGAGPTTVTAQNAIQVWADQGTGLVFRNTISGIAYDNTSASTKWLATSILNYYAELEISENTINGAHMGVYNIIGSGAVHNNFLNIEKVGVYAFGILAVDPPDAIPAPYDPPTQTTMSLSGMEPDGPSSTVKLTINGNQLAFSGADNTSTYGIEADAGYYISDDLEIIANNNIITGFEVGMEWYQGSATPGRFQSITANNNCLANNTWGMDTNASYLTVNAENNYWGSTSGPSHSGNPAGTGVAVSDYIDYVPWLISCGGTSTGNFENVDTGEFFATLGDAINDPDTLNGHTIQPVRAGTYSGSTTITKNGVIINLNGGTFTGGSPFLVVDADDVTVLGPGLLDGWTGTAYNADPAILVEAGADNFILDGAVITRWADGVELAGSVTSFKMVNNYIYDNIDAGLQVDVGTVLNGIVTIEGNLFKANGGNGIQMNGLGMPDGLGGYVGLPALYNSWGDKGGPTVGNGDRVSSNVYYDPYTFIEPYLDMWPNTDATVVTVNELATFNVTLEADITNVYGISFAVYYDPQYLTAGAPTFQGPWASAACATQTVTPPTGMAAVAYRCNLLSPEPEVTGVGAAIASLPFTANGPTVTGNVNTTSFTTHLDIDHLEAVTSAGAVGGVKVWVNNAGFGAASERQNITDTNDGQVNIQALARFTGFLDLQGRANDAGATLQIYTANTRPGTMLTSSISASSGAYTTVNLMLNSTYYLYFDAPFYLPTTEDVAALFSHSKLLSPRGSVSLGTLLLLGGDADDDNEIGISDASLIGGAYGTSPVCGATCADVNGDGVVNILDLTLMGGNYDKGFSPWTP